MVPRLPQPWGPWGPWGLGGSGPAQVREYKDMWLKNQTDLAAKQTSALASTMQGNRCCDGWVRENHLKSVSFRLLNYLGQKASHCLLVILLPALPSYYVFKGNVFVKMLKGYGSVQPWVFSRLPKFSWRGPSLTTPTFMSALQDVGYTTMMVGKDHLPLGGKKRGVGFEVVRFGWVWWVYAVSLYVYPYLEECLKI